MRYLKGACNLDQWFYRPSIPCQGAITQYSKSLVFSCINTVFEERASIQHVVVFVSKFVKQLRDSSDDFQDYFVDELRMRATINSGGESNFHPHCSRIFPLKI